MYNTIMEGFNLALLYTTAMIIISESNAHKVDKGRGKGLET
jgi:hypothetical protein